MDKKRVKRQNIFELLLLLVLVALLNVVGSFVFHRFDLTQEKRYTLAESTKDILRDLDDIVYVKVYLDGDNLPAGFRRLRRATKEILDEFRVYAKTNLEYEFFNPNESSDEKTRREIYDQLAQDGLEFFNISEQDQEGLAVTQVVFPGAMLSYRAHGQQFDRPVNLLQKSVTNQLSDETINRSVENLEYILLSAITHITRERVPKVALITGHDELDEYESASLANELSKFYRVERLEIDEKLAALDEFEAAIIADPKSTVSEKDKFIIDQFVMKGGKVLWLVDAVKVDLNELAFSPEIYGQTNHMTRIGDMLFTYGARVNTNLIQDYSCVMIPVDASAEGEEEPRWVMAPFVYFPFIASYEDHPITRNLNPLRFEFVSTVDTVGEDPAIKKRVLLTSSDHSRIVRSPFRISAPELFSERPDPNRFPLENLPVAVLLEGEFTSHYEGRLPSEMLENELFKVRERCESPTKMIVIGDGDLARNYVSRQGEQIRWSPLGYDRYNPNVSFGNKDFLLNCMNYLLDDEGLMNLRTREVRLRLMDFDRLTEDRFMWQMINLILPALLVVLGGIAFITIRKRKYSKRV